MLLKHKFYSILIAVGLVVYGPLAYAQWDVTEQADSSAMDDMKDSKFDLGMEKAESVQLQADQVSYAQGDQSAQASGNVIVTSGKTSLYADSMQLNRATGEANADGHFYLETPKISVDADKGMYNFQKKNGYFYNARFFRDPFQVKGQMISQLSQAHIQMQNGYLSTCDHDEPHFKMGMRQMDLYPGDRIEARGVTFKLGQVPLLYMPKFSQKINEKPWFTFMPGYKKDLGYFLLTRSRFRINDYLTTTIRLDAYERQGFGWGMENQYTTPRYGDGMLRTYFINERSIAAKHPWNEKTAPTIQNERYLVEWRHRWIPDRKTNVMWQYFRLSDIEILKKYFRREYQQDPSPDTYFLLTRAMPVGSFGFRVDHRVNRFEYAVDRTPEITYSASGVEFGDSNVYLKTSNSYSNLVSRAASPTEDRRKTMRVDSDNELTYPMKISFIQFTPMVGGDNTYYSRTIDARRPTNIVRSTFKTGADLNTRFFKVFAVPRGLFGQEITRMRHIVAPSVTYRYQHTPTFAPSRLNQFDSAIDGLDKKHTIGFSLENKVQYKRNNKIVDVLRDLVTMEYVLRQEGIKGHMEPIKNLLEFMPVDWLKITSESLVDTRKQRLKEHNLDFYFKAGQKFGFNVGDRFVRGGSHELSTQVAYIVNPKWRLKVFDRYDLNSNKLIGETYTITRDLHEWEMDLSYDQAYGGGREIMMAFRLKAFPNQPLDLFSTSFHQRKAGTGE